MRIRRVVAVLSLGLLVGVPSCGRDTETLASVKARYAQRFVEGIEFGTAGYVSAGSYDRATFRLADVRIDAGRDALMHADYAEILVDPARDTIQLRLEGVVGADAATGVLTERGLIITDPIKVGVNIVDAD